MRNLAGAALILMVVVAAVMTIFGGCTPAAGAPAPAETAEPVAAAAEVDIAALNSCIAAIVKVLEDHRHPVSVEGNAHVFSDTASMARNSTDRLYAPSVASVLASCEAFMP